MDSRQTTTRIRELIPADRQVLLKILRSTGVFHDSEITIADEVLQESLSPASTYKTFCVIDEETEEPAGYVCVGPTPCTSGTFDLYWIAVDPAHQKSGLGKLLMEHAEEHVRTNGARMLLIETSSMEHYDKTRRFYLNTGYKQVAMVPDFYRPGDHKIIYGKNFV